MASLAARALVSLLVAATLVGCSRAPQAAAPAPANPPSADGPAVAPADDRAVADFYQGKNLRLVVPYTAGGAFDVLARMLARVLPQYVPGRPNVIVENKTGAAGLLAVNTVYAVEPKAGAVGVMPGENLVLLQAVGAAGVEFDARKMNWLARATRSPYACLVRLDTGVTSIQEVIDGKEVAIAGTSPGTALHDTAAIMNGTLGTHFKIVPGYGGAADMRVAMEKKEVDGNCNNLESLLSIDRPRIEGDEANARVLVIMGDRTPAFSFMKGLPAAETLAKTEEARLLLRTVNAPSLMGRPFATAPGVPPARVAALRQAFTAALADPQFLAEAERSGFRVDIVPGDEVARIVEEVQNTPPATLARVKEILKY